jgi:hypothetical protein
VPESRLQAAPTDLSALQGSMKFNFSTYTSID